MPNVIRYLNSFRMAFPATRRPTRLPTLPFFDGVVGSHQLGQGIQATLLLKNTKFRRLG